MTPRSPMPPSPLSERALNRATLARQLLLRRERVDVVEAVRQVVALQAQEAPSPYLALWNRIDAFDPADLDRAFRDHAIVKATLMRVTLHAVVAADYPTFHEAMQPTLRAARLNDARFVASGLTTADAEALVAEAVEFAHQPRSNADVEAWLEERVGSRPKPGPWWAMRSYGPFVHHPTGGSWSFGPRPAYRAAPVQERSGDVAAALRRLVCRYLEGFGPATVQDVAQFALVQRSRVREAVEQLGDGLVRRPGPNGVELLDVPGGLLPHEDSPAPPRLLPMWDSILLAYADRGRVIPPDYRRLVIRTNGDVLPTLLVDGFVAGVWRPLDGAIEATAFSSLGDKTWAALDTEAAALLRLLADREPTAVYRRYARWWEKLPPGEARLLGRTSPARGDRAT